MNGIPTISSKLSISLSGSSISLPGSSSSLYENADSLTTNPCSQLRLAVISDAAPGRNGVGAYYQDLLEQLTKRLAEVRLFSPTIENGRWRAGLALPLPGDSTQKLCLPNPWRLAGELRRFQPDLIIVATPGPYGLLGAYLAQRRELPLLIGFHTSFEQITELYWPGSFRGRIVHQFFSRSHTFLFRRAQRVLANSNAMLDLAQRMGALETGLIGTPIAANFVNTPRIEYTGNFQKLLFAGRLAAEKNLDAILEAAARCPQLQFSIAGDGPLRAKVEEAAERLNNLHYLGWLDRDALREQIDAHDTLLLPSHFESFGTIALEAMARERLVLVSSGCGIGQWPSLRPGLFVSAEGEALHLALDRIRAMTPQQRRAQARKARDAALELNERCLEHWCQLLVQSGAETAAPHPSLIDAEIVE